MLDPGQLEQAAEAAEALRKRFAEQFGKRTDQAFRIEPGWVPLVEGLLHRIKSEKAVSRIAFSLLGIYEKYGELRADWICDPASASAEIDSVYQRVSALINLAELQSAETCQACSLHGIRDEYLGWCMTLCAAHRVLRRYPTHGSWRNDS